MKSRKSHQQKKAAPPAKSPIQTLLLAGSLIVLGLVLVLMNMAGNDREDSVQPTASAFTLDEIPFDGARAFGYLEQLCEIGPRPSGSPGMATQQDLLEAHFQATGGIVHRQEFIASHPEDVSDVPMTNLIVQWKPDREERILLCAHYDTLPYPMLDPVDPRGTFVGANDGGSGVAVLMQLAQSVEKLLEKDQTRFGLDFVLFDGEEFIFTEDHPFFLGSEHFARAYRDGQLPYEGRYRWAVLLDMIGDADLSIPQEQHGTNWPDSRRLVRQIWSTAERLGVHEFVDQRGHLVSDDHVALHDIGGIPACDLIDFDYPAWHTQDDTPERCSPESLAKVGWVVEEWLKTAE